MTLELSKTDALELLRLHFAIQELTARQKALLTALSTKHKVNSTTHDLDVLNGRFVPKPSKEKKDE